jgi:hypothetical protein
VEGVKHEGGLGGLASCEVWIFTGNEVAENIYCNGSLEDRALFDWVLDLKHAERDENFQCWLVHIAGTRMIQEGMDGGSRGEIHLDSLLNSSKYRVPLGDWVCDRSKSLVHWLTSWLGEEYKICEPEDWFHSGTQTMEFEEPQVSRTWVWDPPPFSSSLCCGRAVHRAPKMALGASRSCAGSLHNETCVAQMLPSKF